MLSSTELYANTPLLQTVLWIEAAIYLGIGLFEVFDDFLEKPKQWMSVEGRMNGWLMLESKIGHKMHAGICVLLGFTALNGALEGQVTRFELELVFLSFAVIMPVIWSTFMPGRLGFIVVAMKPEFWLQIVMFTFFGHLIRLEVVLVCVVFNLWGVAVYILHTRKNYLKPYTYETLRRHLAEVDTPQRVQQMDKFAGHKLPVAK